ncbi:hypothetical protein ACSFXN_00815 [Planococcus sp. 1R117A]|uniref:hypothetical protein n=1 Tax=Planococcus sp. 1R117A TaxID=3447020 RepID=UPI003EDB9CC5
MEFYGFVFIMAAAIVAFYLLMTAIEKIIVLLFRKDIAPLVKIPVSFISAFGILLLWQFSISNPFGVMVVATSGVILLFYKYWFIYGPRKKMDKKRPENF